MCSGATSLGVCGPHTCWAAHIREVADDDDDGASILQTRGPLVNIPPPKIYSRLRCTQRARHGCLDSRRLMKATTSDLVPRNHPWCSELRSADLFQLQFFLCLFPKVLKVKTDALFSSRFMLLLARQRLALSKYCTFPYVLFPALVSLHVYFSFFLLLPPPTPHHPPTFALSSRVWRPKTLLRHLRLRGDSGQM